MAKYVDENGVSALWTNTKSLVGAEMTNAIDNINANTDARAEEIKTLINSGSSGGSSGDLGFFDIDRWNVLIDGTYTTTTKQLNTFECEFTIPYALSDLKALRLISYDFYVSGSVGTKTQTKYDEFIKLIKETPIEPQVIMALKKIKEEAVVGDTLPMTINVTDYNYGEGGDNSHEIYFTLSEIGADYIKISYHGDGSWYNSNYTDYKTACTYVCAIQYLV